MVLSSGFDGLGRCAAFSGVGASEDREMHSSPEGKTELAIEGDRRMVRAEDVQERNFGPRAD
jgi:hypothetical protein